VAWERLNVDELVALHLLPSHADANALLQAHSGCSININVTGSLSAAATSIALRNTAPAAGHTGLMHQPFRLSPGDPAKATAYFALRPSAMAQSLREVFVTTDMSSVLPAFTVAWQPTSSEPIRSETDMNVTAASAAVAVNADSPSWVQGLLSATSAHVIVTDRPAVLEQAAILGKDVLWLGADSRCALPAMQRDQDRVVCVNTSPESVVAHLAAWAHAHGAPRQDTVQWPLLAAEELASKAAFVWPRYPVSLALQVAQGLPHLQRRQSAVWVADPGDAVRLTAAALALVAAHADHFALTHSPRRILPASRNVAGAIAGDAAATLQLQLDSGSASLLPRLHCSAQPPHPQSAPLRRLNEVLRMPSYYNASALEAADTDKAAAALADKFAVTVIADVWRRPQYFNRMLWAIGNQTHRAKEVWVTAFNSKSEANFTLLAREYEEATNISIKLTRSDYNYKYFGRFALAALAKTPFVALFDDDCIPGSQLLHNLLHMMHVKTGEYHGLLSMKGHSQLVESPTGPGKSHELMSYWRDWNYRPETPIHADVSGGLWFLRTEWLRQMFRELPPPLEPGSKDPWSPWETAEDFHISYACRKFLGLPTHLFATSWGDSATWGHSNDYFAISADGDTTNWHKMTSRMNVWLANIMKGDRPVQSHSVWGETWNRTNVAVLLPSAAATDALAPIISFMRAHFHDSIRIMPIVALDPTLPGVSAGIAADPVTVTRNSVLKQLNITFDPLQYHVGVFDLDLPKLASSAKWRATDLEIETELALSGVLDTVRPAALLVPFDTASHVVSGALATAATLRIPTLAYMNPQVAQQSGKIGEQGRVSTEAEPGCVPVLPVRNTRAVNNTEPLLGALPAGPRELCAATKPLQFAQAPYSYVTNCQVTFVRQLFDLLCGCERASSGTSGGGTYSRCPDLDQDVQLAV
jgi:hypothetical protein